MTTPPSSLLVWTVNDPVIENRAVLEREFDDIRQSGVGGVAAFVRCSRYTWSDALARSALKAIGRLCRRHHMHCWVGPDPRFVSRDLIDSTHGLEVLLYGNAARADVTPNFGTVINGRFSVRCQLSPRHVHTINEVAIEYFPLGIAHVYAVRHDESGRRSGKVIDITSNARFFYNARDRYVEAFGALPRVDAQEWRILALFRARTNHVDYSNKSQIKSYLSLITTLHDEGCVVDGVMWDEPGFTCTYGTMPFTGSIRRAYEKLAGQSIDRDLWKLALDADDHSHIHVRNCYYQVIQQAVNDANKATTRHIRQLWGKQVVSGIHDTWHFESADMCDMNHGSLDLWRAMRTKTGGFVDLGAVNQLRDPASPWYANLAAMSTICASLGKGSSGKYAYNNLWTVDDDGGEGWQASVMQHCVHTMALFGTRWLAHAYGPVGTIGQETTFLGSPPLPGYPDHSTWQHFPVWTRQLTSHLDAVEHRLPWANVLIVFPLETLYALADARADACAGTVFRLILALLDNHYHVDMLSSSLIVTGQGRYDAIILPFPQVIHSDVARLIKEHRDTIFFLSGVPERFSDGRKAFVTGGAHGTTIDQALAWLESIPGLRPVQAPQRTWVTVTPVTIGTMVTLSPSRHGYRFSGGITVEGGSVDLPELSKLTRIFVPREGTPSIMILPNEKEG
jgi:hypothetical protein